MLNLHTLHKFDRALKFAFKHETVSKYKFDDTCYEEPEKPKYRPQYYTPRKKACCPKCDTITSHPVVQVLEKGKGRLLECVWCFREFNTLGNCRV